MLGKVSGGWASIVAKDRGTGPPPGALGAGGARSLPIPWPVPSAMDGTQSMTGKPESPRHKRVVKGTGARYSRVRDSVIVSI